MAQCVIHATSAVGRGGYRKLSYSGFGLLLHFIAVIMSNSADDIRPVPVEEETEKDVADVEKPEESKQVLLRTSFDELGVIATIKLFKKAVLIGALAAFATSFEGYQISITGTIIANKGFIAQFGTAHSSAGKLILDANVLAVWGGIQSLGQGIGMLTMHFVADNLGRKIAFFTLWTTLLIAVCFESFGKTWQLWLVAKLFSGYAVGSCQFMNGLYMSEISPSRIRGFLITSCFIWYGVGQLFASIALEVLNERTPNNYLDAIYTEWAVVGVLLGIYFYIPESPYWCSLHGQHDKGQKAMERLYGGVKDFDTEYHYLVIRRTVEEEQLVAGEDADPESSAIIRNLKDIKAVFTGTNAQRTLIAFMPSAVQQIGGLAVLSNYSSYFAQTAGFADPFLYSLLLALSALVMVVACAFLTDKSGRRSLFLIAVTGSWVISWIIGGMGLAKHRTKAINALVLTFSLFWRMLSTAIGSLHWTYTAETSNSRLRAKTAGIASAGGVIVGIIFSTSVPYMLNANYANWGLKTILFFAGISTPAVVASFFLMPDTSNRTPAEINEMFAKGIKPWRFRSYVTDAQKELRAREGHGGPAATNE